MPLPDFATLNPGYEERKKEAERRKALFRNPAPSGAALHLRGGWT
jgi:hypothetical protein